MICNLSHALASFNNPVWMAIEGFGVEDVGFRLKIICKNGTTVIIEKAPNKEAKILNPANRSLCIGNLLENEKRYRIFFKSVAKVMLKFGNW